MHAGCVPFKQNFQTRSPKALWSRTVRKLEVVDVGSFRPQGTPYYGLYGEPPPPPPPQKGVPFLSKMVYKRVGGWILPGVACLYIILLCLHQTLDKQRVRKRCIVKLTRKINLLSSLLTYRTST